MTKNYYEAIKERRSVYNLTREATIPEERIREIVEYSLDHTPSAFNSQTGRVVMLFGKDHDDFWEMTKSSLKAIQPEERHKDTEEKLEGFRNSYGTALFFEDYDTIESLQSKFEAVKDNFPLWSYQSSGMLQYNVWTSLSAEGMGASLQHYIDPVEEEIKSKWNLPGKWKLMAQMPFGKPASPAGDKEIMEASSKLKVFGIN
ncbi:nitroreductase family protein [Gudongella sp. DL1XJH-153]|uniref:nitroreductase family protein n=1 Tax=Gudongella sp. DL1XJH-153 TaxID=3409804 RepID=UPI003BB74A15